jgi:peptidoglycan/xylan/chitin deacetylase (PgdA/CDA1 family)
MADGPRRSRISRRALFTGVGVGAAAVAGAGASARATGYGDVVSARRTASTTSHLDLGNATSVKTLWRANTTEKVLALSFDDGPGTPLTRPLLEVLREEKVRASFGIVGSRATLMRDVIRDEISGGHELFNHSWSHPDLSLLEYDRIRIELERTDQLLYELSGARPAFVRPPYGRINGVLLQHVAQSHQSLLMWQMRFAEEIYDSAGLAAHVVDNLSPGMIVLGHDVGPARRAIGLGAVPAIIRGARKRGYSFVTPSELLALDAEAST